MRYSFNITSHTPTSSLHELSVGHSTEALGIVRINTNPRNFIQRFIQTEAGACGPEFYNLRLCLSTLPSQPCSSCPVAGENLARFARQPPPPSPCSFLSNKKQEGAPRSSPTRSTSGWDTDRAENDAVDELSMSGRAPSLSLVRSSTPSRPSR